MGFDDVHDYVAGKVDWLAHALPREGGGEARIGDLATTEDVAVLDPRASCAEAREALGAAEMGAVLTEDRVLLGVVTPDDLSGDGTVEDVMDFGASTFRPHVPVNEMAHYVDEHSLDRVIVTTSSGELVGIVSSEALAERHSGH